MTEYDKETMRRTKTPCFKRYTCLNKYQGYNTIHGWKKQGVRYLWP